MNKVEEKQLLIVHRAQFGYHTDVYKWCEYLRDEYKVSTITFDDGKPRVSIPGVKNHYVSCIRNRVIRGVCLIMCSIFRILFFKGVVIVCYFPKCQVLGRMFKNRRMAVDFRTMSVMQEESVRQKENAAMREAARIFPHVIAISEGVARQLLPDISGVSIVSLGADEVCTNDKSFDQIHLLYVGTFEYRHLEKTILGLKQAMDMSPSPLNITYDIVGDGHHGEAEEYRKLVSELGLEDVVRLHGYVQHKALKEYYERCNVGVSFVPLTEWFEYQPVTKTFEYALSGLYTIATCTYANSQVVTESNGILIEDTAEAFAYALLSIARRKNNISSDTIRMSMKDYTWESIINNQMRPALNKI